MSFLKKLFGKKDTSPSTKTGEDPYVNAPAFKQMMNDLQKEQAAFDDIFDKIVPVIKPGMGSGPMKIMVDGKEIELPKQSTPVSTLTFDDLSVVFMIDRGVAFEWLQYKQIEVVAGVLNTEQLLQKACENLITSLKSKWSLTVLKDGLGLFSNCDGIESSLALIPEIWDKIHTLFKTDELVFAIPTQDVFVFCDKHDNDHVNFVTAKAKEVYNNPEYKKKISPKIYSHNKHDGVRMMIQSV